MREAKPLSCARVSRASIERTEQVPVFARCNESDAGCVSRDARARRRQPRDVTTPHRVRTAFRDAWRRLRGGELGPERAAGSVGVGLFVGFIPTYGIQTLICLDVHGAAAARFSARMGRDELRQPADRSSSSSRSTSRSAGCLRRGEWVSRFHGTTSTSRTWARFSPTR